IKKEERLTSRASLQNENMELQWFKAKLQERGMDLRTQGEINDILVDKVSRYEREKRQAQDELKEIQNPKPNALGITPPVDYDALEEKTNQIERITQLIGEARNLAKVTATVSKAPGLSSMSQDPGPGPGPVRPSQSPAQPPADKFVVGQKYQDKNGNVKTYMGNGQWQ
ncbi:MAG: hypothetical protein KKC77_19760, partial [Proteobacteria bacterium]|nr:hypothetical protein [Pseudomonadota bacterium]